MIDIEGFHPVESFTVNNRHVELDGIPLAEHAKASGTPCYIFSLQAIHSRLQQLRNDLPEDIGIRYAVKANPNAAILAAMAPEIDGFDIASGGELKLLQALGIQKPISFAGPGKLDTELQAAVESDTVLIVESANELNRVAKLTGNRSKPVRCRLRIDLEDAVQSAGMRMSGGPTPFGMDASQAKQILAASADSLEIEGFHFFPGSQILDAAQVCEFQKSAMALVDKLWNKAKGIPKVTLGGGFGIPYHENQQAFDVAQVSQNLGELSNAYEAKIELELGRFLVAEAGVYVTRIVDTKMSHGSTVHIVDGGLHHCMSATGNFGQVIKRPFPIVVDSKVGLPPTGTAMIAGRLCTPMDVFARKIGLPPSGPGDLIVVFRTGAYGQSASPVHFLGNSPCPEVVA